MDNNIQITGTLNLTDDSSVQTSADLKAKPTKVMQVSFQQSTYPQTGDRFQNDYLVIGILCILISLFLLKRQSNSSKKNR